jgi:hypothetical protein
MFCLRNISLDTLHKGDNDDDGNGDDDDDDSNNNNNSKNNSIGWKLLRSIEHPSAHHFFIAVGDLFCPAGC